MESWLLTLLFFSLLVINMNIESRKKESTVRVFKIAREKMRVREVYIINNKWGIYTYILNCG